MLYGADCIWDIHVTKAGPSRKVLFNGWLKAAKVILSGLISFTVLLAHSVCVYGTKGKRFFYIVVYMTL